MAASGTVTVQGNVMNLPTGAVSFGPLASTTAAAVVSEQTISLSSGNNTITLPANLTTLVLVGPNGANPQPNPSYGGVLTLKGVNGDTGVVFSSKWPLVLQWDAGTSPSTIVVNASVSCTINTWSM